MNGLSDVRVVGLGLLSAGARTGLAAGRVALLPAAIALRAPLVGAPLRRVIARLARDGEHGVADARARVTPLVVDVLGAPEVARAIDRILAGPLTDAVARAVSEHHVVERIATQLLEEAEFERITDAVLEDPRTERILVRVLESRLVDDLTGVVLASPEMERLVHHIASSPEVLSAVTRHTESLAGEVVADVRSRSQRADDALERRVRRVLRRPRPEAT